MQWHRLGRAVSRPDARPLASAVRVSFVIALVGALTLSEQFFALDPVLQPRWRRCSTPRRNIGWNPSREGHIDVSTLARGGPIAHLEGLVPDVAAAGADVDIIVATRALAARFEDLGVPALRDTRGRQA